MDKVYPAIFRKPGFKAPVVILALAGLLVFSSGSYAQQTANTKPVDSSLEKIIYTVAGDTFPTLGVKVFGSIGMGRLLAEYNNMDFATEFEAGVEIIIPTHLQPKQNFATVAFVKGGRQLHVAGSNQTVKELETGQRIYTTDVIVTDETGFVSVTLSNGSVLNVQPGSRVQLSELSCLPRDPDCEFSMESQTGSVSADVRTRSGQDNRFLIKTPYASAAVRGTVFDFDAGAKALKVGVTEGEVAVVADTGDISLPGGFGSRTEEGSEPGEPVPLLEQPNFLSPLSRISAEDKIAWNALDGARSYQLSVSEDAAGSRELYRESLDSLVHSVRPLPVGDAYLSLRGVDNNELKGFPAVFRMNIVSVDESLPRPLLEQSVEGDTVFVSPIAQMELLHELQFSQREDFSSTVSVDVPSDGGAVQRLDANLDYYVRGRIVADDSTVGAYGPVIQVRIDDN